MRKIVGAILFLFLILLAAFFFWKTESAYQQTFMIVNGFKIAVDEAKTDAQKTLGLGGQQSISEDRGMLFIYNKEQPLSFWMKGMLMPIDIIWLDKNCRVVSIERDLPPCPENGPCPVYTPKVNAQFVLETHAGFADRHKLIPNKTIMTSSACTP